MRSCAKATRGKEAVSSSPLTSSTQIPESRVANITFAAHKCIHSILNVDILKSFNYLCQITNEFILLNCQGEKCYYNKYI